MTYTTLRVSARGTVLFEDHAQRLGPLVRAPIERFAATASEGIYAVQALGSELLIERRRGTRLIEGLEARFMVSPVVARAGPFAKPAPPSPYDSVRAAGALTLLTNSEGDEIYETCVASVMAWDGQSLVLVPSSRPRVLSTAETFVAREFRHRRSPIRRESDWGLLVMNAVASVTPVFPERQPFDPALLAEIRAAVEETAGR